MKIKKLFISFLLLFAVSSCGGNSSNETQHAQYDVSNEHFTYIEFITNIEEKVNLEDSAPKTAYSIEISAICEYDLNEVSMKAELYDDGNTLVDTINVVSNEVVYANTIFTLSKEVSSVLYTLTTSVVATFEGRSADDLPPLPAGEYFTVTFVNNNSTPDTIRKVKAGERVSKPINPTKTNYAFEFWCTDEDLNIEYNFYDTVSSDFTLYAKYAIDYTALTNNINTSIMKTNVTVYSEFYTSILGMYGTPEAIGLGSGVIFYENDDYYYLLTNNHVTVKDPEFGSVKYSVEDYKGNKYTATVKEMMPEYDLAVVCFEKGKEDLEVASRLTSDPSVGSDIIAIGQPLGEKNVITYGNVLSYMPAPKLGAEDYQSNVTFDVIKHSAIIDHGSSGGALYDMDFNLVGINYAGATTKDGDYLYSLSIPITKVNEFLTEYAWN